MPIVRHSILAWSMLTVLVASSETYAAPITIFMQGEVNSISTPPGLGWPGAPVSATIVLTPGFDDAFPDDPESGHYSGTVSEFTFSVGSLDGTARAGGSNNYALVYDGEYSRDEMYFRSEVSPGFVAGGTNAFIQFGLTSNDLTLLSSDAFPTVEDLEAFQSTTLVDVDSNFLQWDGGRIDWDVTSFTVVPEPSTALLLLTALALSARRARATSGGRSAEPPSSSQPERPAPD